FQGHDTTSAGISFTIFLLAQHPDVQEKIYEELKSFFDTSKPITPNISDHSELKYLEMVIKESLRLYPPVPIILRNMQQEIVLPESKAVLPEGTSLYLTPFGMHRNPNLYPDPEKFDPERFSADECARRHPYAYLPFSAGPRNCIGQRFAMLEMKNVIAKLVWNFRVLPEPGFEPSLVWEVILTSQTGLFVRLEERQRESN
ncbi:Cytochrome P450 9e2, partial [Gryllus bimaculatus]